MVSIITPSFNCGPFIAETIRSVQAQTYKDWELLFQDDCSTDGTREIVAAFAAEDSRIKYECNPERSGAAVTRNNALKRATGKWVAFLDSDDVWYPEKLEKQVDFMMKNGYKFSYTGYTEINNGLCCKNEKMVWGPKHVTKRGMYCYCWPGCLTVMYDREHVGLVQVADIEKNNDYAMWLQVCQKADCYLLKECLAKYRRGRSGSISTQCYAKLVKWHYRLFRKAEGMNRVSAFFMTCLNIICGVYKKLRYVR